MKIKLTKAVLDAGGLCSSHSHQGFKRSDFFKLNLGDTIEVNSIPEDAIDKVEEVKTSSTKTSSGKKGD